MHVSLFSCINNTHATTKLVSVTTCQLLKCTLVIQHWCSSCSSNVLFVLMLRLITLLHVDAPAFLRFLTRMRRLKFLSACLLKLLLAFLLSIIHLFPLILAFESLTCHAKFTFSLRRGYADYQIFKKKHFSSDHFHEKGMFFF